MRGNGLAPPIISTYAVGARTRAPASAGGWGRSLARPAAALLGTASALAVVLAWPDTKMPERSDPIDGEESSSLTEHTGSPPQSSAVGPGFSFRIESSQ